MLSPAARFHFDVNGFVIVPDVLSPDEVSSTRELLDRMVADPALEANGAKVNDMGHHLHFGPMISYDPLLVRMASHPRIVGIAQDLAGGAVRLEETEAIVNRRPDNANVEELRTRPLNAAGFHRGITPEVNHYQREGRHHYLWTKALILLSDVGSDDGGTLMIRGSHRMPQAVAEILPFVSADLIVQAEGRAGSVLMMAESCAHSTSVILSDRVRYVLINGYTPPWTKAWPGHEPSEELVAAQDDETRAMLTGTSAWDWGVR